MPVPPVPVPVSIPRTAKPSALPLCALAGPPRRYSVRTGTQTSRSGPVFAHKVLPRWCPCISSMSFAPHAEMRWPPINGAGGLFFYWDNILKVSYGLRIKSYSTIGYAEKFVRLFERITRVKIRSFHYSSGELSQPLNLLAIILKNGRHPKS